MLKKTHDKTGKTVETITHDDAKRLKIPTVELSPVARREDLKPVQVSYRRRAALGQPVHDAGHKPAGPWPLTQPRDTGVVDADGGGGCNAGYGYLALALIGVGVSLFFKKRRDAVSKNSM